MELLPVDGASISVISGTQQRETLYASDEVIDHVESLQFTLGEGPCFEAFNTRRPVLVPALAQASAAAWPIFAEEVAGSPVQALFTFPIQSGAISIGAMNLYRRQPGWLSENELETALQVMDLAAVALLGTQVDGIGSDILDVWLAHVPRNRAEVHQATGMLISKFGLSPEQASARLRSYVFVTGARIETSPASSPPASLTRLNLMHEPRHARRAGDTMMTAQP